jgi:hypothetical protein
MDETRAAEGAFAGQLHKFVLDVVLPVLRCALDKHLGEGVRVRCGWSGHNHI